MENEIETLKGFRIEKLDNGDIEIIGFRILERKFLIKKPNGVKE